MNGYEVDVRLLTIHAVRIDWTEKSFRCVDQRREHEKDIKHAK